MPPPREHVLPAAKKIFVDRVPPQRAFEEAAFSIPANRSAVQVFYGVGGQGKTALCRELWRKTDPAVDPSYKLLRRAELDLHRRQKDDPDLLLVWVRNGFAQAGVETPAFDLALALTWEATRGEQPFPKLSKPWLRRTTSVAEAGFEELPIELKLWLEDGGATILGEAVGEAARHVPGLGLLTRVGGWAIDKSKRVYLERTRGELQELYRDSQLKEPSELSALLPWMLAQDLNHHLAGHPEERFLLFVDEYERVFKEAGAGARWGENPFDEHMRTLIRVAGAFAVRLKIDRQR